MVVAAQPGAATLDLEPLCVCFPGPLGLVEARELARRLRVLPVGPAGLRLSLPDAERLPAPALAGCVLAARRLRAVGGDLDILAGAGVARSVARAGLCWLLPVTSPAGPASAGFRRPLAGPAVRAGEHASVGVDGLPGSRALPGEVVVDGREVPVADQAHLPYRALLRGYRRGE